MLVKDDEILNSPPKKKPKSDDFFDFMSPVSKTQRKRNILGAVNELETYLEESCQEMDTNPLDYWKIGLPRLRNLVNVYTSFSNRNDSVYTVFPDLFFSLCKSVKSPIYFLKKTLKNVPCANIQNCLVGCCDRTHFK